MAHWSDAYIGLPYSHANCAALVNLVCTEVFDFDPQLPTIEQSRSVASRRLATERDRYASRTTAPREGDAVLMQQGERVKHIGLYCTPGGYPYVLHTLRSLGSACRHPVHRLAALGFVVEGYYSWPR